MNKKELEKKVKELEEELQQVKEALKNSKEDNEWKIGDIYYFINSVGEITVCEYCDYPVDKARIEIGNMYRTYEEAEFEREKQKVITELKKYAFEPDWDDEYQYEHYIFYDHNFNEINYSFANVCQTNELYFETEEKARQAVRKVGENRVKKYYFGFK